MTKICPKCKKENEDTSQFCEECGKELSTTKKVEKSKSKNGFLKWWDKRNSKEKALTGIVACCIGVFLIIAISGMSASDKNTSSTNSYTPTTTNTTNAPTTTSTSTSYETITVGGLKCEVESYLAGGESKTVTGKSFYNSPGDTVTIEVYTDYSRYQEAINFAAGEPGTQKVTKTISGNTVTSYDATDYYGKSYITYFFSVNGKYICVIADGTTIDNHLVESFYKLN